MAKQLGKTLKISPKMLIVEGDDDEHVIYSLAVHYNFPVGLFQVRNEGGIGNVIIAAEVAGQDPKVQTLGILVDADTDVQKRWNEILGGLRRGGFTNLPAIPDPNGTIITETGKPRVGIWLMPDNKLPGMLEDFVGNLISNATSNNLWQLSEKCLTEAQAFSADIPDAKGRIYTYLAWQKEPGKPLGQAITARYLDATQPKAKEFADWLLFLFN
jgi:hypothetical protein